MRQVDRAELTYRLYSAMRKWSFSFRKRMFDRHNERGATYQRSGADQVVRDLRGVAFFACGRSEAASFNEVGDVVQAAIAGFPGGLRAMWLSGVAEREKEARATAANLVGDALERFQILMEDTGDPTAFSMEQRLEMFRFPVVNVAPIALRDAWP